MKKALFYILLMMLLMPIAAGCGRNDTEPEPAQDDINHKPVPELQTPGHAYIPSSAGGVPEAYDPQCDAVRIYWFFNEGGMQIPSDNFFSQRAREEINVAFIPINPETFDYEDILFEMLAAGQQIDVIMTWPVLQQRLAAEGFIQPVDRWLNGDYLPNLIRVSRIWNDNLMAYLRHSDGYIYAIPSVHNTMRPMSFDWIRADWLERVGMRIPTTYTQLTEVLRAFAAGPGRGADYHPFMVSGLWGLRYIFEAFAADEHWYWADDGYLELGMLSPRVVDVFELLNTWFEEELMNQDFMLTFEPDVVARMLDGQVGYHRGWGSLHDGIMMRETNPQANWIPIPPMRSPFFDRGYTEYIRPTSLTRNQYSIHANTGDIDAILRLINWMTEDTATSAMPGNMTFEGAYWYQFGQRGVHWDVIDGRFVGPGGPGTWDDPEKQAAAERFGEAHEAGAWYGWAIRRFLNMFDTRWMGTDPLELAMLEWELENIVDAGLMATDIPLDSPFLAQAASTQVAYEDFRGFTDFFADWGSWGAFAEFIAYPAIMGMDDIETLYDRWLEMANQQGYQEFRRVITAVHTAR